MCCPIPRPPPSQPCVVSLIFIRHEQYSSWKAANYNTKLFSVSHWKIWFMSIYILFSFTVEIFISSANDANCGQLWEWDSPHPWGIVFFIMETPIITWCTTACCDLILRKLCAVCTVHYYYYFFFFSFFVDVRAYFWLLACECALFSVCACECFVSILACMYV